MNSSNHRLRFIFLSADTFPPFRPDVAVLFGDELARRGHQIDWMLSASEKCDKPYQTTWRGCRVWVGKAETGHSLSSKVKKQLFNVYNDLKIFGVLRRNNYDFVQVKDKFISAVTAIVAAKLNNTKFIYWLSYPYPEEAIYKVKSRTSRHPFFDLTRGYISYFLLYKLILPSADHVFVQSEQMKRDVVEKGIKGEKLTAVPMGVNYNKISKIVSKEVSKRDSSSNIVYLGSLDKGRGIGFLLRVLKVVVNSIPEAKLVFVGGAHYQKDIDKLKADAEELGIQNAVSFTGFVPMNEAWEYVKRADIGVSPLFPSPSYRPASPTKLVEYMALGLPVVVNDHPEQKMVIEESGAGLCVSYNEDDFAQAIVTILSDKKMALEMGQNGIEYVKEHRTYKHLADLVERKYFDLIPESAQDVGN